MGTRGGLGNLETSGPTVLRTCIPYRVGRSSISIWFSKAAVVGCLFQSFIGCWACFEPASGFFFFFFHINCGMLNRDTRESERIDTIVPL